MLGRLYRVSCLVGGVLVLSVVWCGLSSMVPEAHQERVILLWIMACGRFVGFLYALITHWCIHASEPG